MSATCTEDNSKQHYERTSTGPRGSRYFMVTATSIGAAFEALGQANPSADIFIDRSGYIPLPVIQATNYRIVKQTPAGAQRSGYFEIEVAYGNFASGSAGRKDPVPNGPAVVTKRTRRTSTPTDVALVKKTEPPLGNNVIPLLTTNKKPIPVVRDFVEHELLIRWVQKGFNSLAYTALLDTINLDVFGSVDIGRGKLESVDDDERTDGYLDCSAVITIRADGPAWEVRALDDDGETPLSFNIYQWVVWNDLKIPGFNAPVPGG